MKKYNVIWFDDEFLTLDIIKENALLNGVILHGFSNSKEGISELERNIINYDAAIVDGKFLKEPDQDIDTIDDLALFDVARAIENHANTKILPWFILSGQPSFTKERNPFAVAFKNNEVYDKLNEQHQEKLWKDIKEAADQQQDTQIRHNNQEIFSIFFNGFLSKGVELQVLELIKSPLPKGKSEIKGMLSNIRSIHESCLLKLEEIDVIPDSQAQFSNVIKHLSGNKSHPTYLPTTKEFQNTSIENLNKWLYFTCGQYIHNLKDENYKDYMISNYAVESLRNGVLELLLWFKKTYIENK